MMAVLVTAMAVAMTVMTVRTMMAVPMVSLVTMAVVTMSEDAPSMNQFCGL
jgi:hypothetical protein